MSAPRANLCLFGWFNVAQWNPLSDPASRIILKSKYQNPRSHGSFETFCVSALRRRTYLTKLLHIWPKYNPWWSHVWWTISRSKSQTSSSHGPFEVFAMYTMWLHVCFIYSHDTRHKCNSCVSMCPAHSQIRTNIKVTRVILNVAVSAPWLRAYFTNHLISGTNVTQWVMMYHASFPGQKVRDQDLTGRSDLKYWSLIITVCHSS